MTSSGIRRQIRRSWRGRRNEWKAGWVGDLTAPGARGSARLDALVFDHGLLRLLWGNMHRIGEGVYRSNQPGPRTIRALAARGFRTVVNLRGESSWGSYLLEREACAEVGLRLVDFKIYSWSLPLPAQITMLADILARAERPMLLHCKSGADRVGIAAAIYQLAVAGLPLEVARRQLSLRYLHFRAGKTGVLDELLDAYGEACAARPVAFLDWVRDGYDPEAVAARYAAGAAGRLLVDRLLARE